MAVVAVGGVATKVDAPELLGASQGCASVMEVARDVRWRAAQGVLRASQGSAYLTVVAEGASTLGAQRVLREVPCSERLVVGISGAHVQVAQRELKVAHPSARLREEANGALSMAASVQGWLCLVRTWNIDVQERSYLRSQSDSKQYCSNSSKLPVEEGFHSCS
ncbi:hypothetical protein SAY86_029097 [Trapa natans]|uniref:Uncharacterized protein n=1 Tax=Trapa natans TaxID=22666 RepID=A0AAN7RF89_TRANT|nr:hypothetical protein SAY86_029097 [Trapa natans]